jgi:RNA polymerase primary sigma factor
MKTKTTTDTIIQDHIGSDSNGYLSRESELHLINQIRSGSKTARSDLLKANLRLIRAVAKKYSNRHFTESDLVQEGSIGLLQAVEKYNPDMGCKFSTYAYWWIRQTITRSIQENGNTIRLPVHIIELTSKIRKIKKLLAKSDIVSNSGPEEIADFLEIPSERIVQILSISKDPMSLSMPVGEDDSGTLIDIVENVSSVTPSRKFSDAESSKHIGYIIRTLTPREETVIRMRFGF